MEQTPVWIANNTDYNLTITGSGPDNTTVGPMSTARILSTVSVNSKSLLFWVKENEYYLQGTLNFGKTVGVYVDRGDLPANDQSIKLQVNFGDKQWVQSANGGSTLVAPDEFTSNTDITLIFY